MKKQISVEELIRNLGEYNIAIHGIQDGSLEGKINIAQLIANDGLKLSNNWKTILASAVSMGNSDNVNLEKDIKNYQYGYGEKCNVVIRVPNIITNSNGEKVYLGFPAYNKATVAQQYSSTCVLDQVCSSLGRVPCEFIYGYYTDGEHIELNSNYYDELSQEQKDDLFLKIKDSMNDFSKLISDCVISGNREKLEQLKCDFEKRGIREATIENALRELEKASHNVEKRELENNSHDIGKKEFKKVTISSKEDIVTKVSAFLSDLPTKRLLFVFGKVVDEKALQNDSTAVMEFYRKLSLQDIQEIENDNVRLISKAFNMVAKFPANLQPDKMIESEIREKMERQQGKRRIILTDQYRDERKEISDDFDKCVASYLLTGGTDMLGRFYTLVRDMSRKGLEANLGKSVLKLGNAFAMKMEQLQYGSERNSRAWNFILPHILQAYTISKVIGNEKYNTEEHKMFEERLINLGLIEIVKENSIVVKKKQKFKRTINFNSPDKPSAKQSVMLEQEQLREVIYQYINTGMLPMEYRFNEAGEIARETELERIRREQTEKKMRELAERERIERERKVKERNQIRIGVNGQPILTEPMQQRQNIRQREQARQNRNLQQPIER